MVEGMNRRVSLGKRGITIAFPRVRTRYPEDCAHTLMRTMTGSEREPPERSRLAVISLKRCVLGLIRETVPDLGRMRKRGRLDIAKQMRSVA